MKNLFKTSYSGSMRAISILSLFIFFSWNSWAGQTLRDINLIKDTFISLAERYERHARHAEQEANSYRHRLFTHSIYSNHPREYWYDLLLEAEQRAEYYKWQAAEARREAQEGYRHRSYEQEYEDFIGF